MSLLITLFLSFLGSHPAEPQYYMAKARNGDGVTVLLHRYQLNTEECNLRKFYEINKMAATDPLLCDKLYKLPLYVYNYDGKSIRSTIGIDDYDKATRIAEYNNKMTQRKLRDGDYKTSKILWVPFHELGCDLEKEEVKPIPAAEEDIKLVEPASKTSRHSIFGKEYGNVEVKSSKLKGKVYYISSGHGGPDPGALGQVGNHMLCEDEYAYDVGLRLARNLMENGAIVHIVVQDANDGIRNDDILICDNDEKTMGTETMPINQLARLKQRTEAINGLYGNYARAGIKEQYLVCIHVDSQTPNFRQDVYFYHFEHSKEGKKLAERMQDVFAAKYARNRPGDEYEGSVSTRNLYMLRMPYPTTLYVELANIKNAMDRKRIMPCTNRQALANWLYEGLAGK